MALSALIACAVLLLPRADAAAVVVSFHDENASEGLYPNGERFDMADLVDDTVMTRLISDSGLSGLITVDALRQAFSIEPILPVDQREPYQTASYRVILTAPEALAGTLSANALLECWADAYTDCFSQRVAPERSFLWDTDIPDILAGASGQSAWLRARLDQWKSLLQAAAVSDAASTEDGLACQAMLLRLAALPVEDVDQPILADLADPVRQLVLETRRHQARGMLSFHDEEEPLLTAIDLLRITGIALYAGLVAICLALLIPRRKLRRAAS